VYFGKNERNIANQPSRQKVYPVDGEFSSNVSLAKIQNFPKLISGSDTHSFRIPVAGRIC